MAEIKTYPKKAYTAVSLSTIVTCAKCKEPSGVYEAMYQKNDTQVFYHIDCVSEVDTEKPTETKVHELFLTDDLGVKSEGR